MRPGPFTVVYSLALSMAVGCHKPTVDVDDAGGLEAPDASVPDGGVVASADVPPPPPLVPADPSIPLHEAVVGAAPIPADTAAPVAPPAAPIEDQPAQPEADDTWIPGYWWWSAPLGRYVWVSGAWRHPPPNQVWTPGSWTPVDGSFVWAPGFWAPQGVARVTVDVAPPVLEVEVAGGPPGVGFLWTPGYYGYGGGGYSWIAGSWARPPMVGVGWVAPRYVAFRGRYCFQPGRWDFAPERRGVAYRPDIDVRAGQHVHFAPVPRGLMVAHANYVSASAHAIAMGATRTPNGGFAMPHAVEGHPPMGELHGAGAVHDGEGREQGRGEVHGGVAPRGNEAPHEMHGPAPEMHGPAPQHVVAPAEHGHAPGPVMQEHGGGKRR